MRVFGVGHALDRGVRHAHEEHEQRAHNDSGEESVAGVELVESAERVSLVPFKFWQPREQPIQRALPPQRWDRGGRWCHHDAIGIGNGSHRDLRH
jgi:hypothetical protein